MSERLLLHFAFILLICEFAVYVESCLEVDNYTDAVLFTYMLKKNMIIPNTNEVNECCLRKNLLISNYRLRLKKMKKSFAVKNIETENKLACCRQDMGILKNCIMKSKAKIKTRILANAGKKSVKDSMNESRFSTFLPMEEFKKPKNMNNVDPIMKPVYDSISEDDSIVQLKQIYLPKTVDQINKEMCEADIDSNVKSLVSFFLPETPSSYYDLSSLAIVKSQIIFGGMMMIVIIERENFKLVAVVEFAITQQFFIDMQSDTKVTVICRWFNVKVVAFTGGEESAMENRLCKSHVKTTTADARTQNAIALLGKSSLGNFHPSRFRKSVHDITASQDEVFIEKMQMVKELAMGFGTNFGQRVALFSYAVQETLKLRPLIVLTMDKCVDGDDKPSTSGCGTSRTQSGENSAISQNHNTMAQGSNSAPTFGGTDGNGGDKRPPHKEKIKRGCECSEIPDIPLNEQEEGSSEGTGDNDDGDDESNLSGQNNVSRVVDQLFDMSIALPSVRKLDDPTVGEHPLRRRQETSNSNIGVQLNGRPGSTVKGLVRTARQICLPGVDNQPEDLAQSEQNPTQNYVENNIPSEQEATTQSSENDVINRSHSQTSPSLSNMVANCLEVHLVDSSGIQAPHTQQTERLDMFSTGQEAHTSPEAESALESVTEVNVPAQRPTPPANYGENAIQSQNPLGILAVPPSSQAFDYHQRNENLAHITDLAAEHPNTPPVSPNPESDILFSMEKNMHVSAVSGVPQTTWNNLSDEERLARMASHSELVNMQTRRSPNVIVEDATASLGINTPDFLAPIPVYQNQNLPLINDQVTGQSTQNLAEEENILNAENQIEGNAQNGVTVEIRAPENSPSPSLEESTTPANPGSDLHVEEAQSSQERRSLQSTSSSMQSASIPSASTHLNENIPQGDAFCSTSETSNNVVAGQPPFHLNSLEANYRANDDPSGPVLQEFASQNISQQESGDEELALLPTVSLDESPNASGNFAPDAPIRDVGNRQQTDTQMRENLPEVSCQDTEDILLPPGASLTQLTHAQRDYWDLHFIEPRRRPPKRGFSRGLNASDQIQQTGQDLENATWVNNHETSIPQHVGTGVEQHSLNTTPQEVRESEQLDGTSPIQESIVLQIRGAEPPYSVEAELDPLPLENEQTEPGQENVTRINNQETSIVQHQSIDMTSQEVRRREHRHGNNAIQGSTPLQHAGTEPPSHDALPPYLVDAEPEPLPLDATPLNDESIEEQPQVAEETQLPGPSEEPMEPGPFIAEETGLPGIPIYVFPWAPQVRLEIASGATFRIAIPETTSRSNDAIPIAPLQESQMQSRNPSPVVGIVNQPNPRLARTFIDPPPRLDRTFHHAPFHQGREMRRCLHCDTFFICLALMVCEICGLPWCAACDNHRQDEARVHPDDEHHHRSFGDE